MSTSFTYLDILFMLLLHMIKVRLHLQKNQIVSFCISQLNTKITHVERFLIAYSCFVVVSHHHINRLLYSSVEGRPVFRKEVLIYCTTPGRCLGIVTVSRFHPLCDVILRSEPLNNYLLRCSGYLPTFRVHSIVPCYYELILHLPQFLLKKMQVGSHL